ncbi:GNAT family N-acetyltransferase [Streptomyces sp. Go-475]|uniref:GNAT family N-acetyltransferase n=1 Tax=Streptomyces sp. Go-475 TaxID=2072505 RepID=UPI000DF01FC4|nr:GNAT family N-acetyltransferase [Streptomyces sp. Go-475]AXE89515.1 Putative ribosomal N-acetyltransferase YdaF [Streptomyces sp. Go-475]
MTHTAAARNAGPFVEREGKSVMDLVTSRLLLRQWRSEDRQAYAELCSDPLVMRYMPEGKPLSPAESSAKIERMRRHWLVHGYGWWAVEERSSGRLIGRVGLRHCDEVTSRRKVEIGWLLGREHWGRGLATEAARACRDFAFTELGTDVLFAVAQQENRQSFRVMERLGMTKTGRSESRGHAVVSYELDRQQWAAAATDRAASYARCTVDVPTQV